MADLILETKNITKCFSTAKALDCVCFQVERGTVHALAGENGAGKSTLMNIISGVYPYGDYEGEFLFDGKTCRFRSLKDSERAGITIIHQELALVGQLSIAENLFLGNEKRKGLLIDWAKTNAAACKYLQMVGLQEDPRTLVKDLGTGKQQLVEIAKALSKNARLLILDEPTSSLNETDAQRLLALLDGLRSRGVTSIIISHKLDEIAQISDAVTILRDGKTIETLPNPNHAIDTQRIIRGMVGREIKDFYPPHPEYCGTALAMSVSDWSVQHPVFPENTVVSHASFHVGTGEIVGFAGLQGSGRTELAMSIFADSYGIRSSGRLMLHGKEVRLHSVEDAIAHGLAYVTEDRKEHGLVLGMSMKKNITLAAVNKISRRGFLHRELENLAQKTYQESLSIRGNAKKVESLSGGNQQKVLLAKWMYTDADILILDEPTRGVDVGAKCEIYTIIRSMIESGKTVVLISSELPELLGMCDRIYVMREGRIVAEVPRAQATQESLMKEMLTGEVKS